ncbi:unnamed protein product [Brugia pahangi]|uniref:Fibrinogen C-terminal domain-containing protein n=1 Tax=Brugia pahangi TaxID=6280 RepID=A0A0N4T6S8_BRUPA|nr:unnamed protein product [Brugia pahangi]
MDITCFDKCGDSGECLGTIQSLSDAIEFNATRNNFRLFEKINSIGDTWMWTTFLADRNLQGSCSNFDMIKVRLGSEAVTVSIEWPQWKQHVGSSFEHLTDAYSFCCQPLVVRRCSVSDLFQPLPCPHSTTVLVSRDADGHPSSKQQYSLLSQHIHSLRRPQDAERMLPSTMSPFPFTSVTNQLLWGYPGSSCHVRAMDAEHTMI